MEALGIIRWSPPQGSKAYGTVPVRIRAPSGTIVVEGVSGRDIVVPVGTYYVGALTPEGYEVVCEQPVEVRAGATVEPVLAGFGGEPSPIAAMAEPPGAPQPAMAGDAAPGAATIEARRWRGDWIAQFAKGSKFDAKGFTGETFELREEGIEPIARDFGLDDLLTIEVGGKRSFHVLPLDECVVCIDDSVEARSIAVGVRISTLGANLTFRSQVNEDTNAFIEFIDHGLLSESRAISTDLVNRGELAVNQAQTSLLRAVLGAYVLLRANELEGLDHWIDQLIDVAPQMPDAYALQAETKARLGEHDAAVDALRRGLDKGCPWLRSGVSYSLERLRLYVDVHREPTAKFLLTEQDLTRFIDRKSVLERAATHLDTGKVFSTFTL